MDAELLKLSTTLAGMVSKHTSQPIYDKIRKSKAKDDDEQTINELETIIIELIGEKNQILQLAQEYDEKIVAQKLKDEDIEYITENVIPLLESFAKNEGGEKAREMEDTLEQIKPLLSKETVNILQLLGFNFQKALGQPLTDLIEGMISSKNPNSGKEEVQLEIAKEQRITEYFKMINDETAYARHIGLNG
ncbi:hypothetical protein [Salimicrobium flavidum]|uniref:Uncharacterized protein n=1 Tax=Salimicrobium flavidum TaxID=570947 RepID=A0A1N7JS04_9BACI|nr:hypothetical protein [Salimicrobium flavidum]SIS52087.1 hypothetical protein SAMN05421687_107121 [Salimicrobium flavidum]